VMGTTKEQSFKLHLLPHILGYQARHVELDLSNN
jgi:hypothetical protein